MRILLLTASMESGGAETHLELLATSLARRGHRVTVASRGGSAARRLEAAGISTVTLPLSRRSPLALARAAWGLRRLLRREEPQLIHVHSRIAACLAVPMARRRGIPVVTTVHARFSTGGLLRRLSRWGDRSIAVGEDLKQYLCEEYGVAAERVTVIPNGIDTARFCPAEPPGEQAPLRLVFVSRLDRDCSLGARLLCQIAPRLAEAFPTLEILLVGGGDALPSLRPLADSVNRPVGRQMIQLTGAVSDPVPLLRSATVFVGVSRAALEAMACGVPTVLGGDEGFLGLLQTDGLADAAACNFCCRGASEMTAAALEEAVCRGLRLTEGERRDLGAALAAYVQKHHGKDKMVEETLAVYELARKERIFCPPKTGAVVLCGYYGFGNLGDDALLRGAIERASRQWTSRPIVALTHGGKGDSPRFGVPCVRRASPLALRRALKGAAVLVFGGGTLLQDRTSLRSLFYYGLLLRYAQRRGVSTELWANGLDELRFGVSRRLVARVLSACRVVGLRDGRSLAVAQALMTSAACVPVMEADLALAVLPAGAARLAFLRARLGLDGVSYAVVSLRGGEGRGYVRLMVEWLSTLRGEGLRLVFVPMFPDEDLALTRHVARALEGVIAHGLCASDLVGLMGEAEVVCGMRLHALVLAAAAGTPFVGFGGEEKIHSFCRERGGVYFTDLYGTAQQ